MELSILAACILAGPFVYQIIRPIFELFGLVK
jgi:hypothetical protein